MQSQNSQDAADLADAAAVQEFLRARARNGLHVGPFSILFSPGDRGPYANYAIPVDAACPTVADIAALEDAFRTRRRTPRLEYVPLRPREGEPEPRQATVGILIRDDHGVAA